MTPAIDPYLYHAFYNSDDARRWGRAEMPEQDEVTRRWLSRCGVGPDAVVVELGCGVATLAGVHPRYVGVELSLPALRRVAGRAGRVNADMQALPIRSSAVDFLFSWAALEHVPYPELVLAEVQRVLKPGGVALLAPAWNVRSWAAKGLAVRPYRALSWPERLSKFTIPVRDTLAWRAMFALPRRLLREARAWRGGRIELDYRRLSPTLSDYVYTDCDAFASIDAHAAIIYFRSRGWLLLSPSALVRQVLVRHEPVVARKPGEGGQRGERR